MKHGRSDIEFGRVRSIEGDGYGWQVCQLQSLESYPGGGTITKEEKKEEQIQSRIRNPDEETHQEASTNCSYSVDVEGTQCNQEGTGNEAEKKSTLNPVTIT